MARYRNKQLGERSALGYAARADVMKKLNELRDSTITAMVTFDVTPDQVVEFLLPEDTRRILREAYGMVASSSNYGHFDLAPHVQLRVGEWYERNMATPSGDAVKIDYAKAASFMTAVTDMARIIDDFAAVRAAIMWLDRNSSINALRYYFPSVLSLVPDKHRVPYELSERFVQPQGVAAYVPLIRETAGIVASALLLPEAEIPATLDMQLQFAGRIEFMRQGVNIEREATYINI